MVATKTFCSYVRVEFAREVVEGTLGAVVEGVLGVVVEGADTGALVLSHPDRINIPTANAPTNNMAPNKLPLESAKLTGLLPQYWNKFCVINPLLSTRLSEFKNRCRVGT